MANRMTQRNLEPASALEKTLRSIVDTETVGVVKLGIGSDTVEISNEVTLDSIDVTGNADVGGDLDVTGDSALGGAATDKIGMYGATAVVQAAAIADPTDEASNVVAITAILVALENIGIIASS